MRLLCRQVLGEGWAFLVTDITRGRQGNNERLAFVFDRQRVRPSGPGTRQSIEMSELVSSRSRVF